jgi:hypothetical protein
MAAQSTTGIDAFLRAKANVTPYEKNSEVDLRLAGARQSFDGGLLHPKRKDPSLASKVTMPVAIFLS